MKPTKLIEELGEVSARVGTLRAELAAAERRAAEISKLLREVVLKGSAPPLASGGSESDNPSPMGVVKMMPRADGSVDMMSGALAEVVEAVTAINRPAPASEIARRVGKPLSAVRTRLRRAHEQGLIGKVGRGHYAPKRAATAPRTPERPPDVAVPDGRNAGAGRPVRSDDGPR